MLERREFGEGGLACVRERPEGDKSLLRLLREGLNLSRGAVWAYLQPAMANAQAVALSERGRAHAVRNAKAPTAICDRKWGLVTRV